MSNPEQGDARSHRQRHPTTNHGPAATRIRAYQSDPRRAQQPGPPPTQPTPHIPSRPTPTARNSHAPLDKRLSISGRELAIQTLQRARVNGFTRATATTMYENTPARALLRALHFRRRSSQGHVIEFGLELQPELTAPGGTSCRGDPIHSKQPTTREEPPSPSSTARQSRGVFTPGEKPRGGRERDRPRIGCRLQIGDQKPDRNTAPSSVGLQAPGCDRPVGRERACAQASLLTISVQSADPTAELG